MRPIFASLILLLVTGALGCSGDTPPLSENATSFVFAWAADEDNKDSDFLAIIDADPASSSYGDVVTTLPVGELGTMPHHTEHVMPDGGTLFINGFDAGKTFLIDLTRPAEPKLSGSFVGAGPFTYPHSFERMPNGHVLATFQTEGEGNQKPGGLAELDREGNLVRSSSALGDTVEDPVRPYSLAIVPELDRVVSTSADMRGEHQSRAVQIWRLSDLSLIKTILLPHGERGSEGWIVGEPRVLQDGRTVLVGTFSCGLYLIEALESADPGARLVHAFPFTRAPECALAARIRNYWVQTVPSINGLISLDVTDPANPVEVDRLELGESLWPHWISPDSDSDTRLVLTGYRDLKNHVVLVNFDPETGALALDRRFGDPTSSTPGVEFARIEWPHGATGPAIPHGAVFSRTPPR